MSTAATVLRVINVRLPLPLYACVLGMRRRADAYTAERGCPVTRPAVNYIKLHIAILPSLQPTASRVPRLLKEHVRALLPESRIPSLCWRVRKSRCWLLYLAHLRVALNHGLCNGVQRTHNITTLICERIVHASSYRL